MKAKGSFRTLHRTVWEMFLKLGGISLRERMVFLYFEGGPFTHWSGLFAASIVDIVRFTGLDDKEVHQAIVNLSRLGMIVFDFDRQMVFVKGLLIRQLGYSPNEKQALGIVRHVEELPGDSPAVRGFVREHKDTPELSEHFEGLYDGDDTPPGTPADTPPGTPPEEKLEVGSTKSEVGSTKSEVRDTTTGNASDVPSEHPPSAEKKTAGGNGRDKGAEKVNTFIDGLSQLKKSALTYAMTSYNAGDMGIDEVNVHLKASGFVRNEIVKARLIILGEATT